jgi:rhodanese-related sulfurtransferase
MKSFRILSAIMAALLLGIPMVTQVAALSPSYQNIDVVTAYNMIQNVDPNIIIVDVRPSEDYALSHLYGAISVPYSNLDLITDYVEGVEEPILLVYCKTGYTSELACDTFVQLGFDSVYNMLGGILEWIGHDLPVYTTAHHVSVERGFSINIEPLLKYYCGCNSGCLGSDESVEVESTVIEEDSVHKVTNLLVMVNENEYEFVITATMQWFLEEISDSVSRTIKFVTIDIVAEDMSSFSYCVLDYNVQHQNYELALETTFSYLGDNAYNTSFTTARFKPIGDTDIVSFEFVEFSSSMKVSHLYNELSKVIKALARTYESDDIETLADNYWAFGLELSHLSHLVKHEMKEFDKTIISSKAALIDDWLSCWTCLLAWDFLCSVSCSAACVLYPPFCFFEFACLSAGCPAAVYALCTSTGWCP